jgi:hypothetical protein
MIPKAVVPGRNYAISRERDLKEGVRMKYLLAAFTLVSVVLFGAPAWAHVVQATTSVSLADIDVNDKAEVEKALKAAVNDMIRDAIAFKPTLVALTDAQVIGERLYVRVLIADEEGERTLHELTQGDERDGVSRVRI